MNNKWFSGIGLAILLSTGAAIYTTATQARPKAAPAAVAAPDAVLENLAKCATEKNPAYVEAVIKGAMTAFDKDAKTAIKAGKPAEFKKASKNLLKVIKFLFAQSKHFSPIYKDAAHKATFDKDIDKLIQSLFHSEYALAKSQSAKKEVIKDYTAIVTEFKKDGVDELTPITAPSDKAANGALAKVKKGLSNAGSAISGGAKKTAAKAKELANKATAKLAEEESSDDSDEADDEDDAADDAASDDGGDEADASDEEEASDDNSDDADASDEEEASDDEEEASDDNSDDDASADDDSDDSADDGGDEEETDDSGDGGNNADDADDGSDEEEADDGSDDGSDDDSE
jgi:hypothetical protein